MQITQLSRRAALYLFAATTSVAALGASALAAAPAIDAPAPAFSVVASNGETVSLEQFRGKTVVLEWTNDGCPFVQKHYNAGNMQALQREVRDQGGVWLSIISSAPGKQGHADGARADELTRTRDAAPSFVLLDEEGVVGRAYEAKTTPQMVVIDAEGVLRYDGAIDDKPSADAKSLNGATNYLKAAFASVVAGEEVAEKRTKPYGCSVKYPS